MELEFIGGRKTLPEGMRPVLRWIAIAGIGVAVFVAGFASWDFVQPCLGLSPTAPAGTVVSCSTVRAPTSLGWFLHVAGAALTAYAAIRTGFVLNDTLGPSPHLGGKSPRPPLWTPALRVAWRILCVLPFVFALCAFAVDPTSRLSVALAAGGLASILSWGSFVIRLGHWAWLHQEADMGSPARDA